MQAGRTTLSELMAHNDWARDKVCELAQPLPNAALDKTFEIGPGTLRKTLHHLWAAERIWLDRWRQKPSPKLAEMDPQQSIDSIWQSLRDTAHERDEFLTSLGAGGEQRRIAYANLKGERFEFPLGDLMLHVYTHGVHHRAQASNMLRTLGSPVPGLDYLFMRVEYPTAVNDAASIEQMRQWGMKASDAVFPAAPFDRDTIREFAGFGDWATRNVLTAAADLSDAQLDQKFEMGWGSLRMTLTHVYDAEAWWHGNWTIGADAKFEKLPASTSVATLTALYADAGARRDAMIAASDSAGMNRIVEVQPMPGLRLRFRVGESLLQLAAHGTHHRAQAVNMLRRLGAALPAVDYIAYLRR